MSQDFEQTFFHNKKPSWKKKGDFASRLQLSRFQARCARNYSKTSLIRLHHHHLFRLASRAETVFLSDWLSVAAKPASRSASLSWRATSEEYRCAAGRYRRSGLRWLAGGRLGGEKSAPSVVSGDSLEPRKSGGSRTDIYIYLYLYTFRYA